MTEVGMVRQVGEKHVYGGRHAPVPRGGAQRPKRFGPSYVRAHGMRNNNQILHDDQTRCEANFYTVDHEC